MLEALVSQGMSPDQAELEVLCHFRLFRQGKAQKITDTIQRLLGRAPTSVEEFFRTHRAQFGG